MKKIVLLGAGKSATSLIDYLLQHAPKYKWQVMVADQNLLLIRSKIGHSAHAVPIACDIQDGDARKKLIQDADLVISLLPSSLQLTIVKECINFKKNLLMASYLSPEIRTLEKDIRKAGILVLGEMGLDPGIDHMTSMQIIDSIEKKGGIIHSFKTYCGGLVAPESDNNPWHYKITWNPHNVVTAGSAGAVYKENNILHKIPYEELFARTGNIQVPGIGKMEYYPNRDGLYYEQLYGLQSASTFMRATLRYPDFCEGWNALVQLGLTDDRKKQDTDSLSYLQWASQRLKHTPRKDAGPAFAAFLNVKEKSRVIRLLKYLDIFSTAPIRLGKCTNAEILESLLEKHFHLDYNDRDMVVMLHEVAFERRNIEARLVSYLILAGEDSLHTAMAKTVGLPIAVFARLFLTEQISLSGLHIPILPEIYRPVLKELDKLGLRFEEDFI